MKKVFAFLLAVMMLASVGCAWAEETTEELPEIQFRGISFGTTIAEIEQIEKLWVEAYSDQWTETNIDNIILGKMLMEEDVVGEQAMLVEYLPVEEVAGYDCGMAYRYFVRPVENGQIVEDSSQAILYAGSYMLIPESLDETPSAIADLTNKLTQLYGAPVMDENMVVWHGANDVEVVLYNNGSSNVVQLTYAWRGAQPLIDAARQSVSVPDEENVSQNFDGL